MTFRIPSLYTQPYTGVVSAVYELVTGVPMQDFCGFTQFMVKIDSSTLNHLPNRDLTILVTSEALALAK